MFTTKSTIAILSTSGRISWAVDFIKADVGHPPSTVMTRGRAADLAVVKIQIKPVNAHSHGAYRCWSSRCCCWRWWWKVDGASSDEESKYEEGHHDNYRHQHRTLGILSRGSCNLGNKKKGGWNVKNGVIGEPLMAACSWSSLSLSWDSLTKQD